MSEWWLKYKVDVPTGTSGDWKIERFEVNEDEAMVSRIRARFSFGDRGRAVPAGSYTKLVNGYTLVMSDTRSEILDHINFIRCASGDVLIHGLGIGMVARACLMKSEVTSVTVVELSGDVIGLVGQWLRDVAVESGTTLNLIHGDAFTWKPEKGMRWTVVWHDIWNAISGDNYEGMKLLHRRFGKRCDFQDSWCRKKVKAQWREMRRDEEEDY